MVTDLLMYFSSPCVHGKCADGNDTYICSCEQGYEGKQCDLDVNECSR